LSEASDKDVLRVTKDASKDNLKRAMIRIRTEGITNPLPIIHSNSILDEEVVSGMLKEWGITGRS
jgi:hypothetical protein